MRITQLKIVETLVLMLLLVTLPYSAVAHRIESETQQTQNTVRGLTEQALTSIYTDYAKCRTLQKATDTNLTLLRRCPGVGGFSLLLQWDDDALTATAVNPKGQKFDLGIRELFTQSRSYADLKGKAEWRVKREHGAVVPVALIVRVEPMNDMSTNDRPFLAVAKITTNEICVTNKIAAGANENAEARRAADVAANKPCLKAAD